MTSRLMLKQEYPPTQVQPQSSATRDDGHWQPPHFDYAALDKVDAEAGSILIALANQEPLKVCVSQVFVCLFLFLFLSLVNVPPFFLSMTPPNIDI